jgi:hypothetical protein
MSMKTVPKDLEARGRRLWRDVLREYELSDPELAVLLEACRTADLLERLAAELAAAELTAAGSRGQVIVHPIAGELRQQRDLLARLLARLALPSEGEDDGAAAAAARFGRQGAAARWYGKR